MSLTRNVETNERTRRNQYRRIRASRCRNLCDRSSQRRFRGSDGLYLAWPFQREPRDRDTGKRLVGEDQRRICNAWEKHPRHRKQLSLRVRDISHYIRLTNMYFIDSLHRQCGCVLAAGEYIIWSKKEKEKLPMLFDRLPARGDTPPPSLRDDVRDFVEDHIPKFHGTFDHYGFQAIGHGIVVRSR